MIDWFMDLPLSWKIILIYTPIIWIISIFVTVYDKLASKAVARNGKVGLRIPEKSLFVWSALGGGIAMYITMHLIRHKTKHKSFMIGIPFIILGHVALLVALIYFGILPI